MASDSDIQQLKYMNFEQRIKMLQGKEPCLRSAAAISLEQDVDKVVYMLLKQLEKEEAFYTRIAICETLEEGDVKTAAKMCRYIGKIGKNRYKKERAKYRLKNRFHYPVIS